MSSPFQVLSEKSAFHTENGFILIKANLETPTGKRVTWSYFKARDGVIILPLDTQNHVYLKREWRLNRKDFVWEVPSGWVEEKNPTQHQILSAANRELQEEVGQKASQLEKLITVFPLNHLSSRFHLFLATDLSPHQLPPDEHEHLELERLPFDQAYQRIMENQIPTAQNALVFLLAKSRLKL